MKQNVIRFSHEYDKLASGSKTLFAPGEIKDGSRVQLIAVQKCKRKDLDDGLMEYDTSYTTKDGKLKHYPLPKGDLILLVFGAFGVHPSEAKLFTTIRSFKTNWGTDKLEYYNKLLFKEFIVKIKEERA